MSARDRVLSTIIGVLIVATLGAVVYVGYYHPPEEKFTEFYILGLEGQAKDYPTELVARQEARVLLGIVNHEYQEMTYRVVVTIDERKSAEIGPLTLDPEEKWEQPVAFVPTRTGLKQKVEFFLYKMESSGQHYDSLHIWIDVRQ